MNDVHSTGALSALVDDELDPRRRREVEAHLAACGSCAAIVQDLRALRGAAAKLEDRPPTRDLWPSIRDRIEARARARVVPIETRRPGRVALTWTQLAAASVALVVIAGGAMWLALSGRVPMPGTETAPVADRSVSAPAPGTEAAQGVLVADFADETYAAAVADLAQALEASRGELDPATVATIERNLDIIDEAIAETRRALAADPNSVYLNGYLAAQMRRKLDVLRNATTMVADASL